MFYGWGCWHGISYRSHWHRFDFDETPGKDISCGTRNKISKVKDKMHWQCDKYTNWQVVNPLQGTKLHAFQPPLGKAFHERIIISECGFSSFWMIFIVDMTGMLLLTNINISIYQNTNIFYKYLPLASVDTSLVPVPRHVSSKERSVLFPSYGDRTAKFKIVHSQHLRKMAPSLWIVSLLQP